MGDCNMDDVLCNLNILRDVKSLKKNIGNEDFANRFPELSDLSEKLEQEIRDTTEKLKTQLSACQVEDVIDESTSIEGLEEGFDEDSYSEE